MFHCALFSATTGDLPPLGLTSFTLFGASELRRPTLARELVAVRARRGRPKRRWNWLFGSEENLLITLFGATCILEPTLAEEHAALSALVRGGQLAGADVTALLDALEAEAGGRTGYRSFTLFGACVSSHCKSNRERKALDAAAASGSLDPRSRAGLDALVDAPRGVRWRALTELVAAPR